MLTKWLVEFRRLNSSLEELVELLRDLRTIAADTLGWRVVDRRQGREKT